MRQGYWEFYLCQVDGRAASIFLDLDLKQRAGDPALPDMAYIRIYMLAPGNDGLSSSTEAPRLADLEDAVEKELCADPSTLFVGRNTSDGYRDLFFYTGDASSWTDRVKSAMSTHRGYEYECGSRPDPEWRVYRDFLFPSNLELQCIGNRKVCDALQEKGDALTDPRDVRHWIYLPTEAARQQYVDWVVAHGFSVRETPDNSGVLPFGLCVSRTDLPSFATIDDICLPLYEKALELAGVYDGWESVVVLPGDTTRI